ncbi:MAG: DUF1893 domain-containing protein [Atribacterota bacterium]|nr:DUF1893 domain-containing protein [Atribacterota bacterium]MDD4897058.1 DUF1893 domain-containing protein [Atribacterota bacterium]MDD5637018.1 DUF1893 domain-containing protein [Atribacterota bacterium]
MTNMDDLNKAKEILQKEKYTFVLIKRGKLIKTSYKKGVLPLLEVINGDDQVLNKAIIADKVIGRAAALLVANYQVKAVYAGTISENAREILDNNSVFYQFGQCVPYIKNRNQTDQCPLEKLTSSISSSDSAYEQILQFYQQVLKINI